METQVNFYIAWIQSVIVMVIPLALAVWGLVAGIKPFLVPLSNALIKKFGPDVGDKAMFAIYTVLAFGIGYGAAAYLVLLPFALCVSCPGWFSNVPAWANYLTVAFLVAFGENILHQLLSILVAIKEWLRSLKPAG